MRFPQFARLGNLGQGQFLYALELSNGVIKVGRTFTPFGRLTAHGRQLAHAGMSIVRFEVVSTQRDSALTERELVLRISRFATVHRGYEWFTDAPWGSVVTLLRQIGSRQVVEAGADLLPEFPDWRWRHEAYDARALTRFLRAA